MVNCFGGLRCVSVTRKNTILHLQRAALVILTSCGALRALKKFVELASETKTILFERVGVAIVMLDQWVSSRSAYCTGRLRVGRHAWHACIISLHYYKHCRRGEPNINTSAKSFNWDTACVTGWLLLCDVNLKIIRSWTACDVNV